MISVGYQGAISYFDNYMVKSAVILELRVNMDK